MIETKGIFPNLFKKKSQAKREQKSRKKGRRVGWGGLPKVKEMAESKIVPTLLWLVSR